MRLRSLALLLVALLVRAVTVHAQEAATGAEQTGTISGQVLDKSTGEGLIDAGIEVVDGGKSARTDLDGKYAIRIKPGTYQIRVFAGGFQGVRLQNVTVAPGQVSKADAVLAPAGGGGIVVEVVAQASKAAETTQLLKRKRASVVSDTISAETIKKTGGSDAADVVAQAPAVIVKDAKFIQVRGLTERYASALLNGSRLPSTDPSRRVIPLDLFPAGFLDSLSIVKSYTPDLPGDFSGGLAMLELRDFPDALEYSLGTSVGGNTQSTFHTFDTYRGSKYDYLGYGEWFRGLPEGTPDSVKSQDVPSEATRAKFGRRFRDIWNVEQTTAPPNFGGNFNIGNTWGPFGAELAAVYSNGFKHRDHEVSNQFTASGGDLNQAQIASRDGIVYDRSVFETRLGAVLSSALKLSDNDKLFFRALYDRNSEDTTLLADGFRTNDQTAPIHQNVLQYQSEELDWGQLGGEHKWSLASLDWRTAYSRSLLSQPDTRYFTRVNHTYTSDSRSGQRFFDNLEEHQTDSAVDLTIPFGSVGLPVTPVWTGLPAKFKTGIGYAFRDRDFQQRKFKYFPPGTDAAQFFDPSLPPDDLFAPSHIGPGGFDFNETTEPRDSYTITQEIAAAYGMVELPIIKDRLRFIGGLRYEYSYIQLNSHGDTNEPTKVIKNDSNPLPGANLVLSPRDDMNVRLAWSQSVSRPDFRELSPTIFAAPLGGLEEQGNPSLQETKIENYDLRWEWFYSPAELVSASVFFKKLDKPIEPTLVPSSSNSLQTWANAIDGQILGIEVEGRKNFGFIAPRFQYLTLLVNGTWADSEVNAPRGVLPGFESVHTIQTSQHRALQDQAPYTVNAALDWSHPRWGTARLQYNTSGPKIALVGANGIPDVMEERRDQLDLVLIAPLKEYIGVPVTLNLRFENILNDQVIWDLGRGLSKSDLTTDKPILNRPGVRDGIMRRYTTGVGIQLGLSVAF